MRIELTQGLFTLVDDREAELVSKYQWHHTAHGYAATAAPNCGKIYLHKLLIPTQDDVDHINGDRLDNRSYNLQVLTRAEHQAKEKANPPKYKGVYPRSIWQKWYVMIKPWKTDRPQTYLGDYDTELEAIRVYDQVARFYGMPTNLNEPGVAKSPREIRSTFVSKRKPIFRGVSKDGGRWAAKLQGRRLGNFSTPEEAARAPLSQAKPDSG